MTHDNQTDARTADNAEQAAQMRHERRGAEALRKVTGWTRVIATIPAVGLFIAAIALAVATIIQTVESTYAYFVYNEKLTELAVQYVEYADVFLWPSCSISWRWACSPCS